MLTKFNPPILTYNEDGSGEWCWVCIGVGVGVGVRVGVWVGVMASQVTSNRHRVFLGTS